LKKQKFILLKNHIANFIFMLRSIKKISILALIILIVTGILKGVLPLLQSYLNKDIIDGITNAINTNIFSKELFFLLIFNIFLQCISFLVSWGENYISQHTGDKIGNYFRNLIIEKCKITQYRHYYDSNFYNQLEKASTGINSSPLHSIQTIIMFFVTISRLLVSIYILSSFNIIVVLILAIFALPSAIIDNRYKSKSFDLSNRLAPHRRRLSYLFGLFYNKNSFKEIRINNAENYVQKKANKVFQKYHQENIQHYKKYGIITLLTTLLNIISQGVVYIWLAKNVLSGNITLGDFTFYSSTAFSFVTLFGNTIQVMSTIKYSLNYIDNLRTFLTMKIYNEDESVDEENKIDEIESIEFKNVCFEYDGNENFSLKNINFKINKGEKVALVGTNGAGKTTLLMILMRFYKPDKGEICINGININQIPLKQYRALFGTIFQDFTMFSFSLRENIAIGNLEDIDDITKIKEVINIAQLNEIFNPIDKYLDIHIGSDFKEGINLSKGQLQRVALARAVFKNSKIMILDEPTASMDANSEYEIINMYKDITKDKISFMVSHRLSSTVIADKIIFLKDGKQLETGSHDELIKLNKEYAKMFNKQAKNYIGNTTNEEIR